jgi:hypothetical protein
LLAGSIEAARDAVRVTDRAIEGADRARRVVLDNGLIRLSLRLGPGGLAIERIARRLPDGSDAEWAPPEGRGFAWNTFAAAEGDGSPRGGHADLVTTPALAGYTVIEHLGGAVTVAAAIDAGQGPIGSQSVSVSPGVSVARCSLVLFNPARRPAPIARGWRLPASASASDRSHLAWPRGAGRSPRTPTPWASYVAPSASASLVCTMTGPSERGLVKSTRGRRGDAGSPAWLAGRATFIPAGQARRFDADLAAMSGLGAVNAASSVCAIASHRAADGWRVILSSSRQLTQAKLEASAGVERYAQTINAGPGRPLVITIPLDVDALALTLRGADGKSLLTTKLPQAVGEGLGRIPRLTLPVSVDVASDARSAGAKHLEGILKQVRAGEIEGALKAIASAEGDGAERSAGAMRSLLKLSLLTASRGQRRAAGRRAADAVLVRAPGLVEAWLAAGETERVSQLTRWSERRATEALRVVGRLRSGRWPGAGDQAEAER